MGAHIPEFVRESTLIGRLEQAGLKHEHTGKVRETFSIPGHPALLLQYVTDRISIFDFVLPSYIDDKGKILVAMTILWLKYLGNTISCQHHLVAYGCGIDEYLPEELRGDAVLYTRALIVQKLEIVPVECIARGYLTGSGLRDYQETGMVCGNLILPGLDDGDELPRPLFTPSTKAESGHDENIDAAGVDEQHGIWMRDQTLKIYQTAADYARERGIIIADTKFEFGTDQQLADEVLTPDSSRFWDFQDWERTRGSGHAPSPMDKQLVRDAGKQIPTPFANCKHLGQLDPENAEHIAWVDTLVLDRSTCMQTTQAYHTIFTRLSDTTLSSFQISQMGLPVKK